MQDRSEGIPVRRIGARVEIHAGVANAGRTPHVLSGDDLVLLIDRRDAALVCQRREHRLPPGLVVVADVGEAIVLALPAAAAYRALYVRPGLLSPIGPGAKEATPASRRLAMVVALAGVCDVVDRVDSEDGIGDIIEQAIRASQLHIAARDHATHPVIDVRDYLRDNLSSRISIDELGLMAEMCRFGLVRAFTREIGIPPHSYQTHLRVLRARELIATGRPLSDVALEVGFSDQSHLTRHFKRLLGVTPGACARALDRVYRPLVEL